MVRQGAGTHLSSVGERLRAERLRLGLNQAEMAALGGVSPNSQINYEGNKRSPDTDYLVQLASSRVDVGFIVTGEPSGAKLGAEEQRLIALFRSAGPDERQKILRMLSAFIGEADQARPKPSELLPEHALLHEMFSTLLLAVDLSEGKEVIADYLATTLQSGMEVVEDPRWIVPPAEDASERSEEAPARKRA